MATMSLPLTKFAGKFQFPFKWLSGSKYNLVGNDLRAGLLPFSFSFSSFSKSTRKREFSVQPCSNLSAYASHSDYGIKVASFVSNDYLCANNGIGITTIRASTSQSIHISSRTFADVSAPGKPNRRAVNQKARREFRSFEDARAYVHTLGLKSQEEWNAWRASGARPYDIPSHPYTYYASSGWLSYGDFLGFQIGKVTGEFRTFEDARTYVHTLGLKGTEEWAAWSASGARPYDIPGNPQTYYASSGWLSFPDFLGYAVGKEAQVRQRTDFRSFEDARAYVHTLGLKGTEEWDAWRASGARPYDIPSHPDTYYASSGWMSYGDFLGYAVGNVAGEFRSFEDARAYVHTLGLKSWEEWAAWSASGARPYDVPSHPDQKYASSGWLSYGDFLGYAVGKKARSLIQ